MSGHVKAQTGQRVMEMAYRQTDYVGITVSDVGYRCKVAILNGIGSGLVHGEATGYIVGDLLPRYQT